MVSFTPKVSDAYWIGQPDGQSSPILFGSARNGVVATPSTDTAYRAWLAQGYAAWPWPNDESGARTTAALDAILESYGLPPTGLTAPTQAQLLAYANAKQWALATGGHAVTVASASHVFATDLTSLTMMGGKVARLAQPNPPTSFNWQTPDGAWLTIAAADFPAIATACADFVQATFDALNTVEAQIDAATITTTAEIDAFAWPV